MRSFKFGAQNGRTVWAGRRYLAWVYGPWRYGPSIKMATVMGVYGAGDLFYDQFSSSDFIFFVHP